MKKVLYIIVIAIFSTPLVLEAQSCGTTNLALSKQVFVSGDQQYHPGSEAVDGNVTTGWYVPTESSYIYVDLVQTYAVCKVVIYWTTQGRGKDYKVQISSDATNWTDLVTRTNNTATTDQINVTASGRYVRVLTTAKVNSWSSLEMNELQVFQYINASPSVSLTAPVNNATFTAGSNISLTANASDVDGTISKVEFYQGSQKLGESLSSPYSITWPNVTNGNYTITAVAYDNVTASTTSSALNIVVNVASTGWSLTGNSGTSPGTHFIGTSDNNVLLFKTNNVERMILFPDGFVGVGTMQKPEPEAKFAVNGTIYTTKLKVTQDGWADYVFGKDYKLLSIAELEKFIKKHEHLPGVPSAAEVVGKPVDVSAMQEILLKKIEELTLYIIDQQKQIEELRRKIKN